MSAKQKLPVLVFDHNSVAIMTFGNYVKSKCFTSINCSIINNADTRHQFHDHKYTS